MPLSLTRRAGEILCIGDDIFIKVAYINNGLVAVKVTAPSHLDMKENWQMVIGGWIAFSDDIIVTLVAVKGPQVTFSVNAPKSVEVHRLETLLRGKGKKPKPEQPTPGTEAWENRGNC